MGVCVFTVRYFYVPSSFAVVLMREEGAGCSAWFVFLVSRDCCVALPRGAMGLVCNL